MLKCWKKSKWKYKHVETTLLYTSEHEFNCEGYKFGGVGVELIMKLGNHGESHPHSPAALISYSAVNPGAGQI